MIPDPLCSRDPDLLRWCSPRGVMDRRRLRMLTVAQRLILFSAAPWTPLKLAPTAYWPLQETSGDAVDAGPGGLTLTAAGSPGTTTGPGTGPLSKARSLASASSQYFEHTNDAALTIGSVDFWLAFWVNFTSGLDTFPTIVSKEAAGIEYLLFASSDPFIYFRTGGTTDLTASFAGTGQWVHVVATFQTASNRKTLWINGVNTATGTDATGPSLSTGTFDVGARAGTHNNKLDGAMAGLAFGKSILTAAQIAQLYAYK